MFSFDIITHEIHEIGNFVDQEYGYNLSGNFEEIIIKSSSNVTFDLPKTVSLDAIEVEPSIITENLDEVTLTSSDTLVAKIIKHKIVLIGEGIVTITLEKVENEEQYGTIQYKEMIVENTKITNIERHLDLELKVFPNPTQTTFSISQQVDQISIYSLQGRLLKSFDNQINYNVSDLKHGVYIIEGIIGNKVSRAKLLIQ